MNACVHSIQNGISEVPITNQIKNQQNYKQLQIKKNIFC